MHWISIFLNCISRARQKAAGTKFSRVLIPIPYTLNLSRQGTHRVLNCLKIGSR